MTKKSQNTVGSEPKFNRRHTLIFGKDSDSLIKVFFGSNAMVAIVVLVLITIFLFKEGAGFLSLYHKSIQRYRLSGLEYVDLLKEQRNGYVKLTQYLNDIKARWIEELKNEGLSQEEISNIVSSPESNALFVDYMQAGSDLHKFVKEKMVAAIALRDRYLTNLDLKEALAKITDKIKQAENTDYLLSSVDRAKLISSLPEISQQSLPKDEERKLYLDLLRNEYEASSALIKPIDFDQSIRQITGGQDRYAAMLEEFAVTINQVLAHADGINLANPELAERIETFKSLNDYYINQIPVYKEELANWDYTEPVSVRRSLLAFLTGKKWVTASDQQDWYGLVPLLTGSLLISIIALLLATTFGVGAAIYVNQIAGPVEQNFIKPYIEFISAIPSVVIGFFGVIVFGEALRHLSQMELLQWVPFFPLQERLNAFTAGCLLALMAIPTIFTLAEDAINNIPSNFTEASLAVGASKLQTTFRIIVPSALSGIISAIMLGFGRVIGETMVVLLCAGNRIKIPDFTEGLGVFFEPVHTMTGIIAQEMGEVVRGSLHYRALFMIGIVLFFISLLINYSAQWVVKKYNKAGY